MFQKLRAYPWFCIIAAKWEVFIPGAAHISNTVEPGGGFKICVAKQLDCNSEYIHEIRILPVNYDIFTVIYDMVSIPILFFSYLKYRILMHAEDYILLHGIHLLKKIFWQ